MTRWSLLATLALLPALVGCEADAYNTPPPGVPPPPGVYPESVTYGASGESSPQAPGGASDQTQEYADTDPSALTDFRSTLDPYGSWVNDGTYGTVWVPSPSAVGPNFVPYSSAGHWVYSDQYTWVSDYSWGWAPFHYGRWVFITGVGWSWIPGRQYAGAWVDWRYGGPDYDYVGWAPAAPFWIWRGGFAVGIGFVPRPSYVFIPRHDVFAPVVASRVITGQRAVVIASHTRPYVASGPIIAGAHGAPPVGPPPVQLGIPASRIARPTGREASLVRAQQFSRPNTAVPLGANPPAAAMRRTSAPAPMAPSSPPGVRQPSAYPPVRPSPYFTPEPSRAPPTYRPPSAPIPQAPATPRPAPPAPVQRVEPVQPVPRAPAPMAPAPRYNPAPQVAPAPRAAPPPARPSAPRSAPVRR